MLKKGQWIRFPAIDTRVRPKIYPRIWIAETRNAEKAEMEIGDLVNSLEESLGPQSTRVEFLGDDLRGFISKNTYLGRGWWWSCDLEANSSSAKEAGAGASLSDSLHEMLESVYSPEDEELTIW